MPNRYIKFIGAEYISVTFDLYISESLIVKKVKFIDLPRQGTFVIIVTVTSHHKPNRAVIIEFFAVLHRYLLTSLAFCLKINTPRNLMAEIHNIDCFIIFKDFLGLDFICVNGRNGLILKAPIRIFYAPCVFIFSAFDVRFPTRVLFIEINILAELRAVIICCIAAVFIRPLTKPAFIRSANKFSIT